VAKLITESMRDVDSVARLGGDGFAVPAGRGAEVAAMVNTLGRLLHLDVIAEGIERSEQAVALLALGCLKGQGYLYSPAVPADEATVLLNRAAHDPRWCLPEPAGGPADLATARTA
jgi:predicted signal transduction protein with EAL and GGDEF domain